MEKIIQNISLDIKRCEDVIVENNYLEIVIAIEEISDKYKEEVFKENENNNVWRYSKKDLQVIKDKLIEYKKITISKLKTQLIDKKISELKNYIDENNEKTVGDIIEIIKEINYLEITKEEKWIKLTKILDEVKNQNLEVGYRMLQLINIIISEEN